MTHIWQAAIILLFVFEEARDSSEDVLAIRVECFLGPLEAFLLYDFDPRTVQPVSSRYTDYATRPILCSRQQEY